MRAKPVWESSLHQQETAPKGFFGGRTHHPELISEEELASEQRKLLHAKVISQQIILPEASAASKVRFEKKSRIKALRAWAAAAFASFVAWVASLRKKRKVTLRGERALGNLQSLSDLYFATSAVDGMDIVAFRAAFGEAYYHILTESRTRNKHHHAKDSEDYSMHLEQFARAASSIT